MAVLPIAFLFLLLLLKPSSSLKCYSCKDDCAKNTVPLVRCSANETYCVTLETDRYHVVRGCYSDSDTEYECTVEARARMECQLCFEDGCNMDYQEPLICRVCDWTYQKSCPIRQRCHIPFGTHHVHCYILYSRLRGFNYGCTFEAPADVEAIIKDDIYSIVHVKCDAHDCNAEVKFIPADHMFDLYRMCYGCNQGHCGQINCPDPYHRYGMFCYRDEMRSESGCMSNLTDYEVVTGFEGRAFIICSTNYCNENLKAKRVCIDQRGYGRYCSTPGQQCVSFKGEGYGIFLSSNRHVIRSTAID